MQAGRAEDAVRVYEMLADSGTKFSFERIMGVAIFPGSIIAIFSVVNCVF